MVELKNENGEINIVSCVYAPKFIM